MQLEEAVGIIRADTTAAELAALSREVTRTVILQECEEAGLSIRSVVDTILSGMNAHNVRQQLLPTGDWSEAPAQIDHSTRLKAAAMGKDILGLDAPKRLQAEVAHGFHISPATAELVEKLVGGWMETLSVAPRASVSLVCFEEELEKPSPEAQDLPMRHALPESR
jgi:hypothetical protein